LLAEGEFALVSEYLERALQLASYFVGDHDLYATLADTAAQQRDQAAIRQYAPRAEELAMRYDHKLYQAVAHRAWGVAHRLAGEYAEAEARLIQALDLFNGLNTRWQIGRTLFELGEVAAARADTTTAHDRFSLALTAFETMQAAPDAARTRAALERLK
jgi:tetratricopeptide (TPR) repeat protein